MIPLCPNTCYHIFNHANGIENVFCDDDNFKFFLEKYKKHITPIAETYAYCLMPNHFHLVVRIRKKEVIENIIHDGNFSKVLNFGKVNDNDKEIEIFLSKQFSNLFSSYTQAFNKLYKRRGSLFIKNFKRQAIEEKQQFINAIIYTHRNPIHHGFCTRYTDWSYTSYCEITGQKSEFVETKKVVEIFGDMQIFKEKHQQNLEKFNQLVELDI